MKFTQLVTVFVTAEDDVQREHWVQAWAKTLAELFGGFTITRAEGGWVDPSGRLLIEPSVKVEALASYISDEARARLNGTMDTFLLIAGQQAGIIVIQEVDGRLHYSPEPERHDDPAVPPAARNEDDTDWTVQDLVDYIREDRDEILDPYNEARDQDPAAEDEDFEDDDWTRIFDED